MSKTTESIRWRGGQVTRLEALTDAVFGFAITLLIVSLEVPRTYENLAALMAQFIPFAFAFAALILVWWYHYQLFSRYDLEDGITVVLNSILLFVVLFYVYPLKFIAGFLFSSNRGSYFKSWEQIPDAMSIYATGFVAVFLVFAALYQHAYRLRARLGLTALESVVTREHVSNCLIMAGVGVLSIILAQSINHWIAAPISGFIYLLIGPLQFLNGWYFDRVKRRLPATEADTTLVSAGSASTRG